jgi:hypothetical protein
MSLDTSYSLLEDHNDAIVYRVPDPTDRTFAYVEIGIYPWQLGDPPDQNEGMGLRLQFNAPSQYPRPQHIDDHVEAECELFSHGGGQSGKTYRTTDSNATDLRALGKEIAQYAHCYWWALKNHSDFTPGLKRDQTHHERRKRLDIVDEVYDDGTVVLKNGDRHNTIYSLSNLEVLEQHAWHSPKEQCQQAFEEVVDELLEQFPARVVLNGSRDVNTDRLTSSSTRKTAALKKKEKLKDGLSDADGIGRAYRRKLSREFDSIADVKQDYKAGASRLRSLSGIGEQKEEAIVDALSDTRAWKNAS